ncbi:hypothetical protein ACKC5O_00505 [Aeromonas schubertii]|uniref:hypothetical protein n=1 Tax=Aeromonas schubertii TaxID=652 RepID=UPI0038B673BA
MSGFKFGIFVRSNNNGLTYDVYMNTSFIKAFSSQEEANSHAKGLEDTQAAKEAKEVSVAAPDKGKPKKGSYDDFGFG